MPTNVIYREVWRERGRQFRITLIPRAAFADNELPEGFEIKRLGPNVIIDGSIKISNAQFPALKPIGLKQSPTMEIGIELRAMSEREDLLDCREYLLNPIQPNGGAIVVTTNPSPDGRTFDTTNIIVYETDNGTGDTWEVLFMGGQRLLPGEDGEIKRPGRKNYALPTTFKFAHISLVMLETILPEWISRAAIGNETPDGGNVLDPVGADGYTVACNLIYIKDGKIGIFAERVPGQRFWLYRNDQLYSVHLRGLIEGVYTVLLRNAYGSVTANVFSCDPIGNYDFDGEGPCGTLLLRKPEHGDDFGYDDAGRTLPLKFKGVIREGSDIVGGYYAPQSKNRGIFAYNNAWDWLKASCDGAACKGIVVQSTAESFELHLIPSRENVRPNGGNPDVVTLVQSDFEENGVKYSRNGGLVKGANVQINASGSLDTTEHLAEAKGIRAEEDLPLNAHFHNMIPMWDVIVPDLKGLSLTGLFNDQEAGGDYSVIAATIEDYSTDTLYLSYAPEGPDGEPLTVVVQTGPHAGERIVVPVLVHPAVGVRRVIQTDTYDDGYDISSFTPLPDPSGTAPDFAHSLEGAVRIAQENACVPHVLAEFLVAEFGAGNVEKPVIYEAQIADDLVRLGKLGDVYLLAGGSGNIFLAEGEKFFENLSGQPQLVAMEPDHKRGLTKVVLLGRD